MIGVVMKNICLTDYNTSKTKIRQKARRRNFTKGLTRVVASAAVVATLVGLSNYFDGAVRDKNMKAVEDASCSWEEVVANESSSYGGWTNEAIKYNDLGTSVGIGGIYNLISMENGDRKVVPGQTYRVPDCD